MDGILVILWSTGCFVLLCCVCSLWQAYAREAEDVDFDKLHSKYSKENIARVKGKRKRTAQEILELKEEIKIAEERLLAEHKYEQKLVQRLKQKERRTTLKRRKRRKPEQRTQHEYIDEDFCLSDSDTDLENLLQRPKSAETDIERGRLPDHVFRRRSTTHAKKDTTIFDDMVQWWDSSSKSTKKKTNKKKFTLNIPRLDWKPLQRPKTKKASKKKYAPSSSQSINATKPKEIKTIHQSNSFNSRPLTKSPSQRAVALTVNSSPQCPRERAFIQRKPKVVADAWGSPESHSNESINLPFSSPNFKKAHDKPLKLSPVETPSPQSSLALKKTTKKPGRSKAVPVDTFECMTELLGDEGLLYKFQPNADADGTKVHDFDDYSDL